MSVQTEIAEPGLLSIPTQRAAQESEHDILQGAGAQGKTILQSRDASIGEWFARRAQQFLVADGETTNNEVADEVGARIGIIRANSVEITVADWRRFQLEDVTPENITPEQIDLVGFSVPVTHILEELTYLANEDSAPSQKDRDLILSDEWDGALPDDSLLIRALVRVSFDENLISTEYLDQAGTLTDIWEADAENVTGGDVRGLTCPKCFTVFSKSGACACD